MTRTLTGNGYFLAKKIGKAISEYEMIKYSAARLRSILQRSSTAKHVLREELLAKQHLCVLALATPCVDALSSPPHKEGRGGLPPSRAVIKDGDRVLVGVSGGKDSLTLLTILHERKKMGSD